MFKIVQIIYLLLIAPVFVIFKNMKNNFKTVCKKLNKILSERKVS